MQCKLCPRECGIDRDRGERGFCGVDSTLRVARAALHAWEEPPISGKNGSGTVFFSGCNLRCVFCQNYAVSHSSLGSPITEDALIERLRTLDFDAECEASRAFRDSHVTFGGDATRRCVEYLFGAVEKQVEN